VARAHGRIQSVNLADGRELPADMVIAAVGVRPRTELARQAGLAVNQGILVDKYLCTSDPDIYAAGDAVETTDLVTSQSLVSGLWTNAVEMGRLTGNNMAGANLAYPGAFGVLNSFEVAGIPTMAIGVTNPPAEEGYRVYSRRRGPDYRKLVCQDEVLVGALLVGDIADGGVYAGLIRGKAKVGAIAEALEHPRAGLASRLFSRIAK
jgi:NAD(P)H-nitrite reductase large subunit